MPVGPSRTLKFAALLTKEGWLHNAYVTLDHQGNTVALSATPPVDHQDPVEDIQGWAIPGFQNAHSHAFQYAMAGLAEHLPAHAQHDDFWTWREAMYRLALTISPDEMEAVAAMLYAEMLRHGYTAVTEFHYLHHGPDGRPYGQIAEMGERLVAAAAAAGIHLTLVPVMYEQGGFETPLKPTQIRFATGGLEGYQTLLEATQKALHFYADARLGVGVHSLRAVDPRVMAPFVQSYADRGPIHLHVAEQRREVDDAVLHLQKRPVEWLLQNLPIDHRFHLVHATHMTRAEAQALGASGATVVLCPSTEGSLGDGLFDFEGYRIAGGGCAIGSDSQIGLSPLEELRWLDYVQRLRSERRNALGQSSGEDTGTLLLTQAWERGRSAMGQKRDTFFPMGEPFDSAVIDPRHPIFAGKPMERILGALIYGGDTSAWLGIMRRGAWVVKQGRHQRLDQIATAYRAAMFSLHKAAGVASGDVQRGGRSKLS